MLKIANNNTRIQFMDGYDLYPDKHVLLGYTEDYADKSGIESGIVLAVGDKSDRDTIWNLFTEYLMSEKHGELFLFYYGTVNASGVYV